MPHRLPAALLLLVSACGRGSDREPFDVVRTRLAPRADSAARAGPITPIPLKGCVDRAGDSVDIATRAWVSPPGRRRVVKQQDSAWLPTMLVDMARTRAGFVVLDGASAELTVFSDDFAHRISWGGRTSDVADPERLGRPRALAFAPMRDTLWVLDGYPPRLVAYDLRGRRLKTMAIAQGGDDLAIDGSGTFYVARMVMAERIRADTAEAAGVAVLRYDRAGRPQTPLVRFRPADVAMPRFNVPGPIEVKVAARGATVAVGYPTSGVVDLYREGRRVVSIATCMHPDVAVAYAIQRARATDSTRSQTWIPLIADMQVTGSGGVDVVSAIPDTLGRFHIDRFDASGHALGSVMIRRSRIRLPERLYFGGSPDELMGFMSHGSVLTWRLRPAVGESGRTQ
jgi:hypothetical protein